MVLAEKEVRSRGRKGLEGSIATWTARELGGRESHSERSNLERREGAEMGEERGRHRYGFLKSSGWLERERAFRGGTNCSSLEQDTCEGANRTGTAGEQRGRKRDLDETGR